MKKVVIFNGPPDSGKDEAARYCTQVIRKTGKSAWHKEFKTKLFELTFAVYGVSEETFFSMYTRELKEVPSPMFGGISPRQALIKVSEQMIKPVFGSDYFGICAAKDLKDGYSFFSDGGFVDEVYPIIDTADEVVVVKIQREGRDYTGDSRGYLDEGKFHDFPNVRFVYIENNSTLEMFHLKLDALLEIVVK